MNDLRNAIWIEVRKVLRSKMPWFTTVVFMLVPAACAFLMIIYKDPEFARKAGLIGAKANIVGGTADWPFYLYMVAQALSIGGMILFSFITSWVFGREWADGTLKDLLAVPVSRGTILLAKFIVTSLWSLVMVVLVYAVALLLGALVGLPLFSPAVLAAATWTLAVVFVLLLGVITPVALLAGVGRGYLLPIGISILIMMAGNLIALIGYGEVFPWSVPAVFAMARSKDLWPDPAGYWIVAATGLAGIACTYLWWQRADQNR